VGDSGRERERERERERCDASRDELSLFTEEDLLEKLSMDPEANRLRDQKCGFGLFVSRARTLRLAHTHTHIHVYHQYLDVLLLLVFQAKNKLESGFVLIFCTPLHLAYTHTRTHIYTITHMYIYIISTWMHRYSLHRSVSHTHTHTHTHTHVLIERNPFPREGFLFTMFPDQEPSGRRLPSKHLVQILRGGSSSSGFLIREMVN